MKAKVNFMIDEGGGKTTTVKKGEDIPREIEKQAARAGYAQGSESPAATERSSEGPKTSRRTSKG